MGCSLEFYCRQEWQCSWSRKSGQSPCELELCVMCQDRYTFTCLYNMCMYTECIGGLRGCGLPGLPSPDVNSFWKVSCKERSQHTLLHCTHTHTHSLTHRADSVDGSNKVSVSDGCTACLYRPHGLTATHTTLKNHTPGFSNSTHLRAPTVAEGLKTISAPLSP